jgi:hypothetical protein
MLLLWRVAVTFVIASAVYAGATYMMIMLAAIPLGIAWDVFLWAIGANYPGDADGIDRIMQSHFTWGAAFGAGAAICWHKVDDWRNVANTPLFFSTTTSSDHPEIDRPD